MSRAEETHALLYSELVDQMLYAIETIDDPPEERAKLNPRRKTVSDVAGCSLRSYYGHIGNAEQTAAQLCADKGFVYRFCTNINAAMARSTDPNIQMIQFTYLIVTGKLLTAAEAKQFYEQWGK